MRRRRFDIQVLFVLLFVSGVFILSLLIRIAEDPFGLFAEPNQISMYCDDLVGLHERAEIRCRGAVVGHVKSIQWGTRDKALATGPRAIVANRNSSTGPEQFWIRAGINNRYGQWKFARIGYIRGAVMESAVTPSWIELTPASASEAQGGVGSGSDIELQIDTRKPGAEGLAEKATEIGDALLDIVHVLNPPAQKGNQSGPGTDQPSGQPTPTPPIQKIVTTIDDMSQTTHSLHEFAVRLEQKGSEAELSKALQELKTSVARLNEHVNEADGAVQKTKEAMAQFKKASKKTEVSATKFSDLMDRVGDTTLGRALIRKKTPTPSPSPR